MEKGYMTVGEFLNAFNWTDVDFEIYKIIRINFVDDFMSAMHECVFDSKKDNWDDVHQFDNMRICNIDGYCDEDKYGHNVVLQLLEDGMQYEKAAKESNNWEYTP